MPRIHLPPVSRTHSANRVRLSKNAVFDRAGSFLVHKKCAELSAHFFVSLWGHPPPIKMRLKRRIYIFTFILTFPASSTQPAIQSAVYTRRIRLLRRTLCVYADEPAAYCSQHHHQQQGNDPRCRSLLCAFSHFYFPPFYFYVKLPMVLIL